MRKSKILFVIDDDTTFGGLQIVTKRVAEMLADMKKVSIFVVKNSHIYSMNDEGTLEIEKHNIQYFFYFFFRLLRKSIKTIFPNSQLNQRVHDFPIFCIVKNRNIESIVLTQSSMFSLENLKKTFKRLKVLLWIHSSFDAYYNNYYKKRQKELIRNIKSADQVICLTDKDYEDIKKFSFNIVKISNPLTIDSGGGKSSRNSKIISATCRYSIETKGLDYLVEIAAKLPEGWKIAIAGSGNSDEIKNFKNLIKKYNVEKKIILRGAIFQEELVEHYLNSSIFMMTSRWEGFGLVMTEAMSFGLPVIAFENSGVSEVLNNGKYGVIVEQGNIPQFLEKLNELIEDSRVSNHFSEKSMQRAKDFDMQNIKKLWNNLI